MGESEDRAIEKFMKIYDYLPEEEKKELKKAATEYSDHVEAVRNATDPKDQKAAIIKALDYLRRG